MTPSHTDQLRTALSLYKSYWTLLDIFLQQKTIKVSAVSRIVDHYITMANSQKEMDALCDIDILTPIPAESYLPILTSPPFVPSKSLINLRDSGLVPGSNLPSSRFYRCGTLQLAAEDPNALAWLSGNVKRIFDLRKPGEREKNPDPAVEGVENVWIEGRGVYPEPELKDFVDDGGVPGWKKALMVVMDVYAPMFRAVLEHIRDRPSEPILFHCTGIHRVISTLATAIANYLSYSWPRSYWCSSWPPS